jgi:hypothetical protein
MMIEIDLGLRMIGGLGSCGDAFMSFYARTSMMLDGKLSVCWNWGVYTIT